MKCKACKIADGFRQCARMSEGLVEQSEGNTLKAIYASQAYMERTMENHYRNDHCTCDKEGEDGKLDD